MTEVESRIFEAAYAVTQIDTEYKTYIEKIIDLEQKILEHLGTDCSLFLEYEKLIGLSEGIYIENVYRIGLEDSQKLALKHVV